MSCTLGGCNQQSQKQFQNFCSVNHLKNFAWRQTPVKFSSKGTRVYFYDRNTHKENYEFSNFFPKGVKYGTNSYKTAEHGFQAQKFKYRVANRHLQRQVDQVHAAIQNADTPLEAVALAKQNSSLIRSDWHQSNGSYTTKETVMFQIVKDKFTRHPNLRTKLLNTKNARLVEAADKDPFWGRGDGSGKNKLGRILMKIRREMNQGKY